MNAKVQPLTKLSVARAQLVTAFDLFVRDKDPISVHCLACGGGEVIEGLADAQEKKPFAKHILSTQPDMNRGAIRKLTIDSDQRRGARRQSAMER